MLSPWVEMQAAVVDVEEKPLFDGQTPKEVGIAFGGLLQVQHLDRVLDLEKGAAIAVFGGNAADHLGAGGVFPLPSLGFATKQHRKGQTLEVEGGETPKFLDNNPPGRGHGAGIAPRDLEQGATHELRSREERQVLVVELHDHPVGLLFAVLIGKGKNAVLKIERFASAGAFAWQHANPHPRSPAIDDRHPTSRLLASPRITSVSTRREGMNIWRPMVRSRVGSMIGSF